MDFPCCPICNLPVPAPELQRHANQHLDEDQLSTDLELAKQLALAASSPIRSRDNYHSDAHFEYDPRLYDYDYDPAPTTIPSSSTTTSRYEGNKDTVEARGIEEQVCIAVGLQCRTSFHKIEGGLMALLKKCLESETQYSKCMLSGYVDHFQSSMSEDAGWGCGWRNIQMATSHLLMHRPDAKEVLFGGCGYVPDIASLQRWMEVAWGKGFDVVGSSYFGGRIYGKNSWIGTTECAGLFRSFGLRARVVDFDGKGIANKARQAYGPMDKFVTRRLNNADNHHKCDDSLAKESIGYQALVDWVWNYFSDNNASHCVKQRVCVTNKMPLYFQHAGHSRTVVGIQVKHQKNGVKQYNLLVLDPAHRTVELEKSLKSNAGWQPLIKRGIHTLKKPQYQLCYVDPGIACGMELEQLKTIDSVLNEV